MSDIQRYSQLVEPPHNLMKSRKGYWCKSSDHKAERKADRERITKQQDDLRSLADAVMKAESLLRNDIYQTRVNNALVELDEVRDIAMNHMSEE